jgi:hypothetical protein
MIMASRKKPSPPPTALTAPLEAKRPTTESPLVFISHDSRDADLAEAFGNLLTDASGGVLKSFRSSDRKGTAGIEYGQEWYRAIMQKLDDATDVVDLLTAHSVNRPWLLYEAGVAKGKLAANDRVFGIALGTGISGEGQGERSPHRPDVALADDRPARPQFGEAMSLWSLSQASSEGPCLAWFLFGHATPKRLSNHFVPHGNVALLDRFIRDAHVGRTA